MGVKQEAAKVLMALQNSSQELPRLFVLIVISI
jgi:hypothetical protein